jgi:hypothetical protein
LSAR